MILIPSLEILGGKLVRLVGGAEAEPTVLSEDPLQSAGSFVARGRCSSTSSTSTPSSGEATSTTCCEGSPRT